MIVVYTLGLYDTRVHAYRQTFGFLNRDLQSVILLSRYFAIKRASPTTGPVISKAQYPGRQ